MRGQFWEGGRARILHPWGVKQKFQKKPRPLAECIQELSAKVVEAAIKLQADLSSMSSSAEQLVASSATPPAPQDPFRDILLASRRYIDLHQNEFGPKPPSKIQPADKEAFALLQDCRLVGGCRRKADRQNHEGIGN